MGHAAAAHLVGMKIVSVVVGSGPISVAFRWRGIRFELHRYALAGGMTHAFHQIENPGKWRQAVLLLGGVGGDLMLFGIGVLVLAWLFYRQGLTNPLIIAMAYGFLASQIFDIVRNLFPNHGRLGRARFPTDGRQLLRLLRAKDFPQQALVGRLVWQGMALLQNGRNEEAQRHYEQAHRQLPGNGSLLSLLMHSTNKTAGAREAARYYLAGADALDAKNEDGNSWAYANFAWNAVLTGDPELLPLADGLSKRAYERLSETPEVQATRGAVLVQLGEHEAGVALLTKGMRGSEQRHDKAGFAPFLAAGERMRGKNELADEIEGLCRYLRSGA
jgi:tetratricopeptide (TPR) repeat protein